MASQTHKNRGITKAQWIDNPISPRLLPLKKGAEHMGLTVWAMRELIWSGLLPVVQFPGGRKQYVCIDDLEALIEENRRTIT